MTQHFESQLHRFIRRWTPRAVRNALRRPKTTVARSVAKLRYLMGESELVNLGSGLQIRCHPLSKPEFSVFISDREQATELAEFVAHCSAGMQLIDAGAHWGLFSLVAVRLGGTGVRAVAIEPSPAARRVLRVNLQLNGAEHDVTIVNAAVGACNGELEMLTTGAGGADYFVVPDQRRSDARKVRQVSIDAICAELSIIPTHLKLDVESYEGEALQGAFDVLESYRPLLFLELHGSIMQRRGLDPSWVLDILQRHRYQRWLKAGVAVGREELSRTDWNARLLCLPD